MSYADLVREYLPTSPQHGLYVAPDVPRDKLEAALRDYAREVAAEDVVALYDNTLLGSAKDGALFLADRLVFQNTDLDRPQTIRYDDVVEARVKRTLLGAARVELEVNRGRATVTERLDCTPHAAAADYIARLLDALVVASAARVEVGTARDAAPATPTTDRRAVEAALAELVARGLLAEADRRRMLDALG